MKKSKLIKILNQLSPEDLRRFRDFVRSPFFNKKKSLIRLWNALEKHLGRSQISFHVAGVLLKLKESLALNDIQLKNLLSQLMKLYQRFLAHQKLEKEEELQMVLSLEASQEKKEFDFINFKGKQFHKRLSENQKVSSKQLYYNYRFNLVLSKIESENDRTEAPKRMISVLEDAECYMTIERLKLYNSLWSNKRHQQTIVPEFIESNYSNFDRRLENGGLGIENNKLLTLYYRAIQIHRESSEEAFFFLKKDIIDIGEQLDLADFEEVYTAAQNHCIKKINEGSTKYQEIILELIKKNFL